MSILQKIKEAWGKITVPPEGETPPSPIPSPEVISALVKEIPVISIPFKGKLPSFELGKREEKDPATGTLPLSSEPALSESTLTKEEQIQEETTTKPPIEEAPLGEEAPPVPPATVPIGKEARLSPDILGMNEPMFDCLAEKGILRVKERLSLASNSHYGKVPYYYKGYSTKPAQYDPEIGGKTIAHVQDYIDNPEMPTFKMAKDGWKIQSLCTYIKADAQKLGCDKATSRAKRLYETDAGKEKIFAMVRNHVSHMSKKARAKYIRAYGRRWWFPPHETLPPYVSHLRHPRKD